MTIHYKLVENERLGDAPFPGALIAAVDCKFNCINCFNQDIKDYPTKEKSAEDLINNVVKNIFNQGIILAGLEWSLQFDEAVALAKEAHKHNLQVMLYTGKTEIDTTNKVFQNFDYIKYGRFEENHKVANHIEYGVVLASSNQHILKRGVDF